MQQNNHSDKEVSEAINQTPKSHNQKKKKTQNTQHTTQSHRSKPRNKKQIKST